MMNVGLLSFLLNGSSGTIPAPSTPALSLIDRNSPFSCELRIRFPLASDNVMLPTELSGALVTFTSGSINTCYASLWYEKLSATSTTGNIYLTSSAGRLSLVSQPIFDDSFYNVTIIRDTVSGSHSLYLQKYDNNGLSYFASSSANFGTAGSPVITSDYVKVEIGSSTFNPSRGQFWAQEFRLWSGTLIKAELQSHAEHFENYGREVTLRNLDLKVHWRLNDGSIANAGGSVDVIDSTPNKNSGTGSFAVGSFPFIKFLLDYSYIPSIDYGWNQEKVRVYNGSTINARDVYHDERFVSLEFNMYDALNEDISHVMSSYEELNNFIGLPVNRYREDYEGLQQLRETYFKRLQGKLNFGVFTNMLDFFDTSFVSVIDKLLPARSIFKGDELVVESHMLERPKYQYQLRPIVEGRIDISGSIKMVDWESDIYIV